MKERIIKIFATQFGQQPQLVVFSPGRINIIGEHTDYNDGFVLPAAVDKGIYLAISKRTDDQLHFYADAFEESYTTQRKNIEKTNITWANYLLGVFNELKEHAVGGCNIAITGDLPIGAGMSSSAAVECATAFALNELFNLQLTKWQMVKIAQMAEHRFAGVLCGIMDQFASMMGKKDHALQLDCRSLDFASVPLNLGNYVLVLFNTNVKHSLASSAYNERRAQCARGVALIQQHLPAVQSLRDATETMLDQYVAPVDALVDQRCRFVVQEIARLQTACAALQNNDLPMLGQQLLATHEGLSKAYEVSCKELDFLVDFVKDHEAVLGARMMGGGFGGCTINLIRQDQVETLLPAISKAYESAMNLPLIHYRVATANGTGIL
jgi:galactokinase